MNNSFKQYILIVSVLCCLVPSVGLIQGTQPTPHIRTPISAIATPGQQVVDYFRTVFESDWAIGTQYNPDVDGMGYAQSSVRDGSGYEPFAADKVKDTMNVTPVLSPDTSETSILNLINRAQTSLFIEQMYIYSTLTDIVSAIISAKNRGVNCCMIVGNDDPSKAAADQFKTAGVSVKIMTGAVPMYFDTMHNKGVIVDGKTVMIASINWSPTSIRENREAGLVIESTKVGTYYTKLFNHDWSVCITYDSAVHLQSNNNSLIPQPADYESVPVASAYTNKFTAQSFVGEMDATLMASPDNCFAEVSALLQTATLSIDISVYTLSSPFLMDILLNRIANGVKVRLLLEKNQVGSAERNYNRWTMQNLTGIGMPSVSSPSQTLYAKGLWASADFDFQHSKYCIIDNDTLIISSGNWGSSSCPKPQDDGDVDGNRDWWIAIYGANPTDLPSNTETDGEEDFGIDGFPFGGLFLISCTTLVILIEKRNKKVQKLIKTT